MFYHKIFIIKMYNVILMLHKNNIIDYLQKRETMKKTHVIKILSLGITALLLTGCVPKAPTLPTNGKTMQDVLSNQPSNPKVARLIVKNDFDLNWGFRFDNKFVENITGDQFIFLNASPGKHWIVPILVLANDRPPEILQPTCLTLEANKLKTLAVRFGGKLKEVSLESDDYKYQQIVQKNNDLLSKFEYDEASINSLAFQIDKNSESLNSIKENIDKNILINKSSSGKKLLLKLTIMDEKEGSQLGRYIFGGFSKAKDYASSIYVKSEFFINNKKIDELISKKELTIGIFGGSQSSLYEDISQEILSYMACKFNGLTIQEKSK